MRFLHVSDLHIEKGFAGVPIAHFLNKRFVGWANLFLRRRRYYGEALQKIEQLRELVEREGIDVVLCTGDYTALGTAPEIQLAREAIQPLADAAGAFVTVPGNHDVYLEDALGLFEDAFDDLLGTDAPDLATDGRWPTVRFFGDHVAVVGVDSTRPNPPIFRSSGRIPDAQLEGLAAALEDERLAGRFVFVMTHYAPRLSSGNPDTESHGLENADALLATCANIERGAVLHGHVHKCYRLRVPEMGIPLCNAGSTTMAGREGLWVYDVGPEGAVCRQGRYELGRYVLGPSEEL